jgi:hypothetical protein
VASERPRYPGATTGALGARPQVSVTPLYRALARPARGFRATSPRPAVSPTRRGAVPRRDGACSFAERSRGSAARASAAGPLELARALGTFALAPTVGLAPVRQDARPVLLAAAPALSAWRPRRRGLDPLRFLAVSPLDDAAYGVGVWWGSASRCCWRALRPTIR